MNKRITPIELYDRLIGENHILTSKGKITFSFGEVDIVVHQRDVVGNIIQEWLEGWLKKNNIEYSANDNMQMPPDFFLDVTNKKHYLLEVKAFNYEANPGFDIADFRMYKDELISKPWMLNVDYLIFGYEMAKNGEVSIKKLWLKKVWEITSPSSKYPMKLQIKKDIVHKIRPCNWESEAPVYETFKSKEDFLSAIEETVFLNPATHGSGGTWRNDFLKSYKKFYGVDLAIPHWNDLKGKYQPNGYLIRKIDEAVK